MYCLFLQALVKARRLEDSKDYVIVEEMEYNPLDEHHQHHHCFSTKHSSSAASVLHKKRILGDEEVLYSVQSNWKSKALFRLLPRSEAIIEKEPRPKVLLRWTQNAKGSFRKFSRMSSKSKDSSTDSANSCSQESPPPALFHQ